MAEAPILILTTGGTIDKVYFDQLSDYQVGDPVVADTLARVGVRRAYTVRKLIRKDSLELTDEDRQAIVAAVLDSGADRVVVTHGTDTMTVTAAALAGIAGKTIVLAGALLPARFAESDASFNLGMAFAAAQIAPPGVYITMSGRVLDAATARKDRDRGEFVGQSLEICQSLEVGRPLENGATP